MFKNVKAEMVRKSFTLAKLATELGLSVSTLSSKLRGKTRLTFAEAGAIKRILKSDLTLEELFAEEV